ncbi:MAG: hypothetical protein ACYSYW_01760 [Planctomycetota bacterium]
MRLANDFEMEVFWLRNAIYHALAAVENKAGTEYCKTNYRQT